MLGSWTDAEDVLQEAFIRWQGTDARAIASPRAFLVTIVSRLCINQLQSARRQREEYLGQWLPEPIATDGTADLDAAFRVDESLSIAFLTLLERLSPRERAVFLLREVFEYDYQDVATIVGESATTCRQILHRARTRIPSAAPRFAASDDERRTLAERFLRASRAGDLAGLVTLLSEDVAFHADGGGKAAAVPQVVHGADRVARLLVHALAKFVPADVESRVVALNGEPAIVTWLGGAARSTVSFAIARGRITAIYLVTNPDKLKRVPPLSGAA